MKIMPIDEEAKDKIFKSISESYLTQEAIIRGSFKDYKYSIDEIEPILESLSINEEKININRKILQNHLTEPIYSHIRNFNYELEKNGKRIVKELDFDLSFFTYLSKKRQINLSFIGDIKNTDDYIWVFSEELEEINFFPFYWVDSTFEEYSRINPFIWWKHFPFPFPIFSNITPFHPSGELTSEKNIQRVREMFDQVVEGTEAKMEVMKRNAKLGGFTTINIVIPVLVISSLPAFISKLPIPDKSHIKEESTILYFYNPSAVPTINLWRIPILVIEQSDVLDIIKKMTVAVFAQLSS